MTSITKTKPLTQFRKTIAVGTEYNMTHVNMVCGNIQEFLDIAVGAKCSNYRFLKRVKIVNPTSIV